MSSPSYFAGQISHPSPLSDEDFSRLKQSVLFTDEDVRSLRMSRDVLADQVEAILDVWYGFVGSHPFLLHYFTRKSDGKPDEGYLAAVRERFARWILDTCNANYDRHWLDYQNEIGWRHHREGKNKTDGVEAVDHIAYRYLPAFIYPITYTLKPFLARKGHSPEDVENMYQAWLKSVILQVTLWSLPYVKEGDF